MLRGKLGALACVLAGIALLAGSLAIGSIDPGYSRGITPGLIFRYQEKFGAGVPGRLGDWQQFAKATGGQMFAGLRNDTMDRILLDTVNIYFNRIPGIPDQQHWQAEDYWATPAETLSSNGADCEDYAIAKYMTLRELGVPVARLRMVYVRAGQSGEAHMVLAYYRDPDTDPVILDNLDRSVKPAAQRTDLKPVYSFNDDDLEVLRANAPALRVSPANNRKWAAFLEKLQQEATF